MSAVDDEIDFGRYGRALVARWWLLLAGLVAGAVLGFLLASSSNAVNRASVTLFLGQPLGAAGASPIQTLGTNPSAVRQVIHSSDALDKAAAASGIPASVINRGATSQAVAGFIPKFGQTPLVAISVTADRDRQALRKAARSLAESMLATVAPYVDGKIANLEEQAAQDTAELKLIDARLAALNTEVKRSSLSTTDKLVLLNLQALAEQRRTNVLADELQARQLLAQARDVELGRLVATSVGQTTARSRRNSVVVGALLGLLAGVLAAILLARRDRV